VRGLFLFATDRSSSRQLRLKYRARLLAISRKSRQSDGSDLDALLLEGSIRYHEDTEAPFEARYRAVIDTAGYQTAINRIHRLSRSVAPTTPDITGVYLVELSLRARTWPELTSGNPLAKRVHSRSRADQRQLLIGRASFWGLRERGNCHRIDSARRTVLKLRQGRRDTETCRNVLIKLGAYLNRYRKIGIEETAKESVREREGWGDGGSQHALKIERDWKQHIYLIVIQS